jgi:hypothetical protein
VKFIKAFVVGLLVIGIIGFFAILAMFRPRYSIPNVVKAATACESSLRLSKNTFLKLKMELGSTPNRLSGCRKR